MVDRRGILVVDGDRAAREEILSLLEQDPGLFLREAGTEAEAWSILDNSPCDVILWDPASTGLDTAKLMARLKRGPDARSSDAYVVVVSAVDTKDERLRWLEEGADDYLTKPVAEEELLARVKVGLRVASHIKRIELERRFMFSDMDVLLVQDGGCAPGYNPVTAFITYHLEVIGRSVYATREGFKSLVLGRDEDFVRLVYDPALFKKMDHIPGVIHAAPLSESRGALLRSERYRDFIRDDAQKKAAETLQRKNVGAVIAIGGNGTFRGALSLCALLRTSVQVFFVPVTIDSDIAGTECIGQHTGIEMGSEKARCYMADARTHKRTYIVEMMGASSGFHALHSCLGARAHLAVLPNSVIDPCKVVEALNRREDCVILVAEGYKRAEREAKGLKMDAASYFYKELLETGLEIKRRVVCEPFSRDIRGAAPNNQDITLAQRMAYNVAAYLKAGTSRLMPAVRSGREYAIPFNEIRTDNMVDEDLIELSNRLTGEHAAPTTAS